MDSKKIKLLVFDNQTGKWNEKYYTADHASELLVTYPNYYRTENKEPKGKKVAHESTANGDIELEKSVIRTD